MTTPRPAWTITEAAKRTGASDSTLRRYRAAGKFPGAYKDSSGAWRFPHEDLLAAGLSFSTPLGEQPAEQVVTHVSDQPLNNQAEQVAQLEQALREERARADSAEQLAASYRENLDDVRRALRMLEAGTTSPEQVTDQPSNVKTKVSESVSDRPSQSMVTTPRTWWARLTGTRR
jgi:DNA-binding transcriptional MerR regulator